jgi:peptidoglycan/LPS O-acetylase OafA/YrhL
MSQLASAVGKVVLPLASRDHNFHPSYRADIDGLRAVAILAVVAFHAFPTILPGGFVGVDIFFVISGFLISSIIFNSLDQGDFRLTEFYAHRVQRIFPALLAVLVACFLFGWIELLPDEYSQLGKHMAGGIGFVMNFLLWGEAGYFDSASELKPLMHLWSLAIEEQFYLLYPLFIVLVWGRRQRVAWLLGMLALLSFALNLLAVASDPVGGFFLPQFRFWELFAGSLLALALPPNGKGIPIVVLSAISVAGLAMLLTSVLLFHRGLAFPGGWALLPVGGTVLLLAGGSGAWANRRILAHPGMRFVGLISYPLYLWHWPLLAFARIADAGEPVLAVRLGAVVLSFLLAWLTYRLVECPIRFGRRTWVKTAALSAIGIAVGFVGYNAFQREGFRFRQKNFGDAEEALKWGDDTRFSAACRKQVGAPEPDFCVQSGKGDPRVALVGDSHANSLYPGLSAALIARGTSLLHLGAPGCAPLMDTDGGEGPAERNCLMMVNHLIDTVAAHPTVETVVLALRGPRNMFGTGFGPIESSMKLKEISWLGARPGAEQPEMFAGALAATVDKLLANGKRVTLVVDWPEMGFDPRACLNVRPIQFARRQPEACKVALPTVEARNQEYRNVLEALRVRRPAVQIFDPWPLLCDEDSCWAVRGGVLLYRDNNHLSTKGSALIGSALAATLP